MLCGAWGLDGQWRLRSCWGIYRACYIGKYMSVSRTVWLVINVCGWWTESNHSSHCFFCYHILACVECETAACPWCIWPATWWRGLSCCGECQWLSGGSASGCWVDLTSKANFKISVIHKQRWAWASRVWSCWWVSNCVCGVVGGLAACLIWVRGDIDGVKLFLIDYWYIYLCLGILSVTYCCMAYYHTIFLRCDLL